MKIKIKQLFDEITKQKVYPLTTLKAVRDSKSKKALDEMLLVGDESEEVSQVGTRDADSLGGLYTATNLTAKFNELQTNFQSGVDTVYNACVSVGSTPIDHTPTGIADAITSLGNEPIIIPTLQIMTYSKTEQTFRIVSSKFNKFEFSFNSAPTTVMTVTLDIYVDGVVKKTITNSTPSQSVSVNVSNSTYIDIKITAVASITSGVPVTLSSIYLKKQ